jgi:hypothetical protein
VVLVSLFPFVLKNHILYFVLNELRIYLDAFAFVSGFQFMQFTPGCGFLGIPMPDELCSKYFVASEQLGDGATCSVYSATNKVSISFNFSHRKVDTLSRVKA